MFGLPLPSVSMNTFTTSSLPGGGKVWTSSKAGEWWIMAAFATLPQKNVFALQIEHVIPDEDPKVLLTWRWIQRELFPFNQQHVMVWKRTRRDPAFGFPASYYTQPISIGASVDIPPDATANPISVSGDQLNPYLTASDFGPPWSAHYLQVESVETLYGSGSPLVTYPLPPIAAKSPPERHPLTSTTNMGTELPEPVHAFVRVNPGESIKITCRRYVCNPAILDDANGLLSDDIPNDSEPAPDEEELTMDAAWLTVRAVPVWLAEV